MTVRLEDDDKFIYRNKSFEVGYIRELDRTVIFTDDYEPEDIFIVDWFFGSVPEGSEIPKGTLEKIDKWLAKHPKAVSVNEILNRLEKQVQEIRTAITTGDLDLLRDIACCSLIAGDEWIIADKTRHTND